MRRFEVVGDGVRPPVWRSALLAVVAFFFSVLAMAFSPASWQMGVDEDSPAILIALAAFGLAVAGAAGLFWRHRIPFVFTIAAALTAVLVPIGNILALIGLAALLGRRRGPAVWWTAGLVGITSTWVVIADALAQPRGASMLKGGLGSPGADPAEHVVAHPAAVVLFIVVGLGLAIGAGLLMRARREASSAQDEVSEQRATSDRLGDEAARRQERERIAREVHDAMGHRLSLLNLHAGAMEANTTDPKMAESARLVRSSAAAAMEDLRSLLAVLRDPVAADTADLPLAKLSEVVRESFGAGQPLSSTIFISDPERADPALARAVYRIVQELLTNARRHAPHEQLFLTVEGGPANGIVIDSRNGYRGGWQTSEPGTSRGLTGIAERAELLGGSMNFGLDDDGTTFRVRIELPWRERATA
ncbi:MAG: histidine kinase [Propionibacteriaceae bacterium]|nr:histidine kinase [Propionibacteriaceae bacterium]